MHALLILVSAAAAADYRATDDNFANPERGFYVQSVYNPEQASAKPVDAAMLRRAREHGISLLRRYWVLSEFRDAPLSPDMLERIRGDFRSARADGVKVIGRFAYNFGPQGAPDAPLARVLQHLDQLQPVLRENSDVLAFLEAGFVGTWGEWHHSTNNLLDHAREIVDKILNVLPADRMTAVRYPRLKTELFGEEPLTGDEGGAATAKARVGAHNDCFLASATDRGTWTQNMAAEKAFYHQDNLFVPQGGETCEPAAEAQPLIGCENALRELEYQHFSTLNSMYQKDVLDGWTKGGCMPEIQRRLGYRFRLLDSSATVEGNSVRVVVRIRNEGFANLYNPRPVILALRNRVSGFLQRVTVETDPRRWMPGEESVIRTEARAGPGEYDVLLYLPDAAGRLQDRPEYAVRFANDGVWEPDTGMNRLATVVKVQ
jgi:hypothetical protein